MAVDKPLFHGEGVPLPEGAQFSELKRLNPSHKAQVDTVALRQQDLWGRDKVQVAIERIKMYEPDEGYYVAFSGGKDSIVILDLVMKAKVKFDAHFRFVGGCDPPEVIRYIREEWPDVSMDHPISPWTGKPLTMWQLIEKKLQPPTRMRRFCCSYLKETGGDDRVIVTGVRWAESVARKSRRVVETCYTTGRGRGFVNPILDWTDEDVWEYIRSENLPVPPLYGEVYTVGGKPILHKDGSPLIRTRVGCVMCPMQRGEKMRADAERWPKIADAYRRACGRALQRRREGFGKVPADQLQWETAEDLYQWWLADVEPDVDDLSRGSDPLWDALDADASDDDPDALRVMRTGGVLGMDSGQE